MKGKGGKARPGYRRMMDARTPLSSLFLPPLAAGPRGMLATPPTPLLFTRPPPGPPGAFKRPRAPTPQPLHQPPSPPLRRPTLCAGVCGVFFFLVDVNDGEQSRSNAAPLVLKGEGRVDGVVQQGSSASREEVLVWGEDQASESSGGTRGGLPSKHTPLP